MIIFLLDVMVVDGIFALRVNRQSGSEIVEIEYQDENEKKNGMESKKGNTRALYLGNGRNMEA